MMNSVPTIVNVADLQRRYRSVVEKARIMKEPVIVVSNGKPDAVLMDTATYEESMKKIKELEEEYLLFLSREAVKEHKAGRSVMTKKGETLLDVLKRVK